MLARARADAAREREELRADLRARAERAEQRTHAYRDELTQLRTADPDPVAPEALRHWERVPAGQLRAS